MIDLAQAIEFHWLKKKTNKQVYAEFRQFSEKTEHSYMGFSNIFLNSQTLTNR